ncbi:alternative ribosome rescue aminoacyl-tRNA hydrolase ArfB [soil metagenome]
MPAAAHEPVDGFYVTTRGHRIAAVSVSWSATRSGGPGGQHANTTDSAVTITIAVAATGLSPVLIERVAAALGPTVTASSARSRSQWRNRQLAWTEALARFDEAAAPPQPPRARTRPSRAARETRLRDKKAAGERKRTRQRPDRDS